MFQGIRDDLYERPTKATADYFIGKTLVINGDDITVSDKQGSYEANIFTAEKNTDFSRAYRAKKNVQDYVFVDGYAREGNSIERRFYPNACWQLFAGLGDRLS